MRFSFVFAAFAACISLGAYAQETEKSEKLDSVVVSVSRAGRNTPVTYTSVGREELLGSPSGSSLPMILSLQPSVVTTNEGGTGLGYSKMTVRGSKGSQVNVTLNGITLNDGESQEVFWVNIPSLGRIVGNVQLQRGLGTSANGAGAFGASVNMNTSFVDALPSASCEFSYGSFATRMSTVSFSSGMTPSGVYASFLYSTGNTDGYIRNAWADVGSLFGVLGWMRGNNSLRFTVLSGKQHTGITWNGIPLAKLESDRTYNSAGGWVDAFGGIHYYDNESDNYVQTHYQLNYTHRFSRGLFWSTTFNFTKGDGYYEQYKAGHDYDGYPGEKLEKFGFATPYVVGGVSYKRSDFLTRKFMDNGCKVINTTLKYTGGRTELSGGLYLSDYDGDHFGRVLWSKVHGDNYDYPDEWYRNNGRKRDATAFARAEWRAASWLTAYAEMQGRIVNLRMTGIDDEFSDVTFARTWHFFNPRAGITARFEAHKAYASVALGHREPGRSDLMEQAESANAPGGTGEVPLKPERMVDAELGYFYGSSSFSGGVNLYCMEYRDMLLETGRISTTGYYIKDNVGRSWRRGVEFSFAWKPVRILSVDGNLTLSTNKIRDYSYWLDTYDDAVNWNPVLDAQGHKVQTRVDCGTVTMLMSPSITGMARAEIKPFGENFKAGLTGKYVGSQYWDNTESAERRIPAYFVLDGFVEKIIPVKGGRISAALFLNNILDREYYADAWVYRAVFANGDPEYREEGLFPQAPFNLSVRLRFEF